MERQNLWTPVLPDRKNADVFIEYIFVGVVGFLVIFMTFYLIEILKGPVRLSGGRDSEWVRIK